MKNKKLSIKLLVMATKKTLFSLSVFQYDIDNQDKKETNFLSAVGKLTPDKNFLILQEEFRYSNDGGVVCSLPRKVFIFGHLVNIDEALKVFAKDKNRVKLLTNLRKQGEYADSRALFSRKGDIVLLPFPLIHTWCVSLAKESVCKNNTVLAVDYEFEATGNGYTFKGLCFQDVLKKMLNEPYYVNITAVKRSFYANGSKVFSKKREFALTTEEKMHFLADETFVSKDTFKKW